MGKNRRNFVISLCDLLSSLFIENLYYWPYFEEGFADISRGITLLSATIAANSTTIFTEIPKRDRFRFIRKIITQISEVEKACNQLDDDLYAI